MNYYTADPHFFHANILKHCKRPFASVAEMNGRILSNYQSAMNALNTAARGTALGKAGALFARVMMSADPEEIARMRHRAAYQRETYLVPGHDQKSQRVNQLIHRALDQFEIYCGLEDDVTDGLEAPR